MLLVRPNTYDLYTQERLKTYFDGPYSVATNSILPCVNIVGDTVEFIDEFEIFQTDVGEWAYKDNTVIVELRRVELSRILSGEKKGTRFVKRTDLCGMISKATTKLNGMFTQSDIVIPDNDAWPVRVISEPGLYKEALAATKAEEEEMTKVI
jgi:hypothetical protein